MDIRTTNLLKALDATAVDLLIVLLEKPLSQKALLEKVGGVTQSNAHKKLERLANAGLIRQQPGVRSRGRTWEVAAPAPTADLLTALLSLSDALDVVDQRERMALHERLATGPSQDHRHLRVVNEGRRGSSGATEDSR